MIAQGRSDIPTCLLDDTDPTLTSRERIELGVLKALVQCGHDMQLSQAMLQETLLLARPEGFLRTILDQGTEVGQLLRSLPVGNPLDSYVKELIAMSDATVAPNRPNAPGTVALSPREFYGAPVPRKSPHSTRDCGRPLCICEHSQVAYKKPLPKARRAVAGCGSREWTCCWIDLMVWQLANAAAGKADERLV